MSRDDSLFRSRRSTSHWQRLHPAPGLLLDVPEPELSASPATFSSDLNTSATGTSTTLSSMASPVVEKEELEKKFSGEVSDLTAEPASASRGGVTNSPVKADSSPEGRPETPEWELLNLSPESRPHSPRSGVRSLKSSASNSSLWSWADVDDSRFPEPGAQVSPFESALVESSHFYFLQADLMSNTNSALASTPYTNSWALSPSPVPDPVAPLTPPAAPPHLHTDALLSSHTGSPSTASLQTPASPSPPAALPGQTLGVSMGPASLGSTPGNGLLELTPPKQLDEQAVLQALAGVGFGMPHHSLNEGLRSLVSPVRQGRMHSSGDDGQVPHQPWAIPAATAMNATAMDVPVGFGSPITESLLSLGDRVDVVRGGAREGRGGIEGGLGEQGVVRTLRGRQFADNAGGAEAPPVDGGEVGGGYGARGRVEAGAVDSGSELAVGGEDRGGSGGVVRRGTGSTRLATSAGLLPNVQGGRQVAAAGNSGLEAQRREIWMVVYHAWEKRRDVLLSLRTALENQKSALWSIALAAAVLGVMILGGWHRERSQNRELRCQIKARDERIGHLVSQVAQLKESLATRRRVLVVRSVSHGSIRSDY